MSCQNSPIPDGLPLVIVSGGNPAARSDVLEELLRYLDGESLAVLFISRQARGCKTVAACGGNICQYIAGKNFWQDLQGKKDRRMLVGMVRLLAFDHDLVVTEIDDGGEEIRVELFQHNDEQGMPIFQMLPVDGNLRTLAKIGEWLAGKTRCMQVWSCLLIGGQSRRMGRPKHLLVDNAGITWAEKLVGTLRQCTEKVVLAGEGTLPGSLAGMTRLADIAGGSGPLAGILAAMRWNPAVSWIICACDMPAVEQRSLRWLLNQRQPGIWGIVPHEDETGRYQPLLAYYDRRAKQLFEKMAQEQSLRIGGIVAHERILTPTLPENLKGSWRNCNTPDDLDGLS